MAWAREQALQLVQELVRAELLQALRPEECRPLPPESPPWLALLAFWVVWFLQPQAHRALAQPLSDQALNPDHYDDR